MFEYSPVPALPILPEATMSRYFVVAGATGVSKCEAAGSGRFVVVARSAGDWRHIIVVVVATAAAINSSSSSSGPNGAGGDGGVERHLRVVVAAAADSGTAGARGAVVVLLIIRSTWGGGRRLIFSCGACTDALRAASVTLDQRLRFCSTHHKYWIDGSARLVTSVTALVKSTPFDADRVAGIVARRKACSAESQHRGDVAVHIGGGVPQ
jgi:hypothetical protein